MTKKENITSIQETAEDASRISRRAQTSGKHDGRSRAAMAREFPHGNWAGQMIRDLARAGGDASQRSGKGGKCGGGLGGQKAGGIKGGGNRKTHAGRKRGV